jgi:hypothetical protein
MRRFILGLCFVCLMTCGIGTPLSAAEASARRALDRSLPELKFDNITLGDAMDFLRDVSGVNIHVNWRVLEQSGIGRDSTINLRLRGVPLRKVLRLLLSEAASGNNLLTFYVDENVIEVTTREIADQQMFTRVYPVDDLIVEIPDFNNPPNFNIQATPTGRGGGGSGTPFSGQNGQNQNMQTTRAQRAQELIDTIQSTVQPEIWNVNGGQAAIRFWNGSLIVTAPRSVHEALGGDAG